MTGLYTDLYEIRMAASSIRRGMTAPATFSLFVRKFPVDRGFMVAAGLADCLRFLEEFRLGSVTKSALDRALFVDAHRLDLTGVHLGQQIGERHGRGGRRRPHAREEHQQNGQHEADRQEPASPCRGR